MTVLIASVHFISKFGAGHSETCRKNTFWRNRYKIGRKPLYQKSLGLTRCFWSSGEFHCWGEWK